MNQNWPTVEAEWWVRGGLLYYSFYFKKCVWNISSQKALWRLTPAFSPLSFHSPHPEDPLAQWYHPGACDFTLLGLYTLFHLSKVAFLLPSQFITPASVISQPCILTLIIARITSYCSCFLFCFLCWSVSFSGHFSISPVHSQCT